MDVLPSAIDYTMGPREAVDRDSSFSASSAAFPVTTGRSLVLTGTPTALRELAPAGVEVLEPAPGETLDVLMRERWFGATGRKVPEIVLEGTIDLEGALVLDDVSDIAAIHERTRRARRSSFARRRPRRCMRLSRWARWRAYSSATRRCSRSTSRR